MRRPLVIVGASMIAVATAAAPASAASSAASSSAAQVRAFGTVVEAESYDAQHGVRTFTDPAASGGRAVAFSPGDRLRLSAVDFGAPGQASGYATWRSCSTGPGTIDLRLDSPTATPFLTFTIGTTGNCTQWYQSSLRLGLATTPTGVHDLYITAAGADRCEFYRLDSFQMIKQTSPPIP
ncbi:carbohydrate-binding protein [Dactylosporangium sp. CS-033363]|uniref:carbohydrate-binding protein n=1 Tax=Dactylosporangium sp. CS-033363 TaxID=3239935 RepID=UPI003D8CF105